MSSRSVDRAAWEASEIIPPTSSSRLPKWGPVWRWRRKLNVSQERIVTARQTRQKDAILVSTRLIVENGLKLKEFFSPSGYAKLEAVAKAQEKAMRIAVRKGVNTATGTDTGVRMPNSIATQGLNGKEIVYHVHAGMSPLQAIEAATANGPLTLGPKGPKAGMLKEGYDADIIALDQSPLEGIKVIVGGKHVTHVWRQGVCYKSPEKDDAVVVCGWKMATSPLV